MEGVSCVLSEDQFLCSICQEVFNDPVTTACGHSFCNICINKHWDNCASFHCPICKEEFSSRPKLKTSTVLSETVSEFKKRPRIEDTESSRSEAAEAGDVPCDICPEPKRKVLKSCLVCQISYCPVHLRAHNTVPHLKKHQLISPVKNLEERICPEHDRPMELFCRDHSQIICVQCINSTHKGHNTVPLKELCEDEQHDLQLKIQERRNKVQELQSSVQRSQKNADREKKQGVDFFNDLIKCVQESRNQFTLSIERKHQEVKQQAQEFIKEIDSEISALETRQARMEEILSSYDHFHFVQTFTSANPAPELNNWTDVSVRVPSYEGRVVIAMFNLWKKKLNPKLEKLSKVQQIRVKKHAVDVTLDQDTAHPNLVVSEDHKQVSYTGNIQSVPNTPERFSTPFQVFGKEKFSSGKFYFEVQVKGKSVWCLGVARESVDRKCKTENSTAQNGFWKVACYGSSHLKKVGVFVDYEEGVVCFTDADTSVLFFSFTDCCFNENILPLLNPNSNQDTAPLIITPITV